MGNNYESLRDNALSELKKHMDSMDETTAKKLAYWISDYTRFLKDEKSFDPKKCIRYKRGAIVKVHLGFRVGSEEGGLHYAVVLDAHNELSSPTVTIIPLTSIKEETDLSKLHRSNISLGDEVYTLLSKKLDAEQKAFRNGIRQLRDKIENAEDATPEDMELWEKELVELSKQNAYTEKISREVSKMKIGSIALVGQVTTISKIRIYDPKFSRDPLSGIRLSSATLDLLDAKMAELFGSNKSKP